MRRSKRSTGNKRSRINKLKIREIQRGGDDASELAELKAGNAALRAELGMGTDTALVPPAALTTKPNVKPSSPTQEETVQMAELRQKEALVAKLAAALSDREEMLQKFKDIDVNTRRMRQFKDKKRDTAIGIRQHEEEYLTADNL